jgi:hypothetical protein
MKRIVIATILGSVVFAGGAFAGPSAKFAATWTYGPSLYVGVIDNSFDGRRPVYDFRRGVTLATIKVPQDKELLVGVSAEIGLTTDTSVKGKNGGAAKAIAGARAKVIVFAIPVDGNVSQAQMAEPGEIILSKRIQTLEATLGGVIETCNYGDDAGAIDVNVDCTVHDEEIGLILNTLAAHHFNFVLPNMNQGEYDIKAFFRTSASAQVIDTTVLADGESSAVAESQAWIGKTMVTVQQVRAAAGGVIPDEIEEL